LQSSAFDTAVGWTETIDPLAIDDDEVGWVGGAVPPHPTAASASNNANATLLLIAELL
jgi:hypothetical protein